MPVDTANLCSHLQKRLFEPDCVYYSIRQAMQNNPIQIQYYNSPCGEIVLASVADELCLCDWNEMPCAERNKHRLAKLLNADFKTETSNVLEQTKKQLDEYFTCNRRTFSIPLHPVGTTFQQQVWQALLEIPYGETRTYKEIALSIGFPKGVRAVAQAIGANGISILIPCHRVIGSNNSLTGFAGGLEAKRILLKIEEQNIAYRVLGSQMHKNKSID